ncbi:MAG TPA: hypothetical protein VMT92_10070 [Steroidobacteraceae bacterium]|nr:hypothetical protein [Steroidobacteraceae bacterium]
MNVYKILGIVALLLAVVAAFVSIPYAGVILAVLGVAVGFNVPGDAQVRIIVSAIALRALAGTFDAIPAAGPSLTSIIGNVASILAGIALLIIFRNIYNRMRE